MRKYMIAGVAALLAVSFVMPVFSLAASLGEVNGDSEINAKDAADVLVHAASVGAGNGGTLSEEAFTAADVNADGQVNSKDAAEILVYSAEKGAGRSPVFSGEKKLSAYISSSWYDAEDEAIYVKYTVENISDDCEAWIGIVPSGTGSTYSATYSARELWADLKTWVENGENCFKVSGLSAGDYDIRICDPKTQEILDWGSTTITQKTPAWKASYKSKVSDLSSGYMYSLYDLNGDEIPELFISANDIKQTQVAVYTYRNGSTAYLGDYGRYGTVFASTDSYLMDYSNAKNCDLSTYYYFNGSSIIEKDYLLHNYDYGTYQVNGNNVSQSTYSTYYSKYNRYTYREVGRTYSKTNTSPIENY